MLEKRCFAAGHAWPYLHRSNRRQSWARAQSLYCWPFVRPECGPPLTLQNADTSVVKLPQDIVYKGLSGAPQHATLFGDSSQPGLYVDRIKFMPGMKVMPHWHPDSLRTTLGMS